MRPGILVCGLNGAGKSTLGRALAQQCGLRYIDNEDLYFPKDDPAYLYAAPRSRQEVEQLLLEEMNASHGFVFTSVKGDYSQAVRDRFSCVVWVRVPRELRLERVRNRSFQKFGSRMLPGGDLYTREEQFFAFAQARAENLVEEWLRTIRCPVIPVDGIKPVEENIAFILAQLRQLDGLDI